MSHPTIKKGDRYKWTEHGSDHDITVTRVSQVWGYADIFVYDNRTRTSWTKRQPLPFHESFKRVSP
jgi:hypothetical protein